MPNILNGNKVRESLKLSAKKNRLDLIQALDSALISGDVPRSIADDFCSRVQHRLSVYQRNLKKGSVLADLLKSARIELKLLLEEKKNFAWTSEKKEVWILFGFKGSGKTTTLAKIANYLRNQQEKTEILCTTIDAVRPNTSIQLSILVQQTGANFRAFPDHNLITGLRTALTTAEEVGSRILLVDTPGLGPLNQFNLAKMESLANEIDSLQQNYQIKRLLVIDSMSDQRFHKDLKKIIEIMNIQALVLSKTDSDSKGGIAMSLAYLTDIPIIFLGTGEKIADLEYFNAESFARRFFGEGDFSYLEQQIEIQGHGLEKVSLLEKLLAGKELNFFDFLDNLPLFERLGGLNKIISALPIFIDLPTELSDALELKRLEKIKHFILSMTNSERLHPDLVFRSDSRQNRIAKGAGRQVSDLIDSIQSFRLIRIALEKISQSPLGRGFLSNLLEKQKNVAQ